MARKNDSPQKAAMRRMMQDYLKNKDIRIKNGADVNSVIQDMMSVLPEDALDEEPSYSKYDYRNKDMEEKILSMYAKGMTIGDIESHMKELYDIDISDGAIRQITDKILPIVKEWQEHPLEEVYAVVFMDALHYYVRSEGRIVKHVIYIVIRIDMSGKKDCPGDVCRRK